MGADHTPGPWKYSADFGGRDIYAADGRTVAVVEHGQLEADARLIAAAPDLLAALEPLLVAAEEYLPDPAEADVVERGRAAIAKAKGEA